MNILGQYFTPKTLSHLVVACMVDTMPKIVMDFGAGEGVLLESLTVV